MWAAYAVSAYGSGLGFGAFSVVAIVALHAGAAQVAALSSAGLMIGALLAVPLGPWVEFRAKRPVMIAMDVARFAALGSVPVAYALGVLTFAQLLTVSVIAAAGKIVFNAASGAYLKTVVPAGSLLVATSRFESTTWSATIVGPPLGGAVVGLLGPVAGIGMDALSYLLSALGVLAIRRPEAPPPGHGARAGSRWSDIAQGWRYIAAHPVLRPLLANAAAVNALIMAGEPVLSVLMLARLHFPVWQYGLAFAVPCIGGLVGARVAPRMAARWGRPRVLHVFGALRACWPLGLAFVGPGAAGLAVVMVTELGLIFCCGVYNPVLAAYRLDAAGPERRARVLTAWSITTSLAIAVATAGWGLLAEVTGPRAALAVAGLLLLATPALLPRRIRPGSSGPDPRRTGPAGRGSDTLSARG
ncbi:MFS transporter [Tsukamurella soli]|uniref:MFS transporter n=1 Tax=Tsukamurella soli TaxID=644556 RepID=A0ABP8J6X0_9ACTN